MMLRIVLLILILLTIASCSSRVVYEPTTILTTSSSSININTATVDELEKLPNIGRKTAEAIVEFRTANGPFGRIEQLMQIRGVSEERFESLRPLIKIE